MVYVSHSNLLSVNIESLQAPINILNLFSRRQERIHMFLKKQKCFKRMKIHDYQLFKTSSLASIFGSKGTKQKIKTTAW